MIRASALSYAIVFILLVGLICSSLIFINAAQKKIEFHYTTDEHLLLDSYSALQFGIQTLEAGDSTLLVHPFGDTSVVKCLNWGGLSVFSTRTFKFNKEKRRSVVVGFTGKNKTCLFLPGNSGGLKIAGNTVLEGDIVVPNKQIETAYLSGKFFTGNKLYSGDLLDGSTQLPELNHATLDFNYKTLITGLKPLTFHPLDSNYSFQQQTSYYQSVTPLILDKNISGNVIIHSFDSIFVSSKSKLNNVILIAPKIRFESGFKGSVQAIATQSICLEKNVQLNFPSYLLLNEVDQSFQGTQPHIIVEEESSVLGGILITLQQFNSQFPPLLRTSTNCTIAGIVYNMGVSEISGNFIGSVYSNSFRLNYGGQYTNHLMDVMISSKRLPANFSFPKWLKDHETFVPKIIQWQ